MTTGGGPASGPMAGLCGGLATCCTVHLLVLTGLLAGVSGFAIGGMAIGVGIAVAASIWLALTLRQRSSRAGASLRRGTAPRSPGPAVTAERD